MMKHLKKYSGREFHYNESNIDAGEVRDILNIALDEGCSVVPFRYRPRGQHREVGITIKRHESLSNNQFFDIISDVTRRMMQIVTPEYGGSFPELGGIIGSWYYTGYWQKGHTQVDVHTLDVGRNYGYMKKDHIRGPIDCFVLYVDVPFDPLNEGAKISIQEDDISTINDILNIARDGEISVKFFNGGRDDRSDRNDVSYLNNYIILKKSHDMGANTFINTVLDIYYRLKDQGYIDGIYSKLQSDLGGVYGYIDNIDSISDSHKNAFIKAIIYIK